MNEIILRKPMFDPPERPILSQNSFTGLPGKGIQPQPLERPMDEGSGSPGLVGRCRLAPSSPTT